MESWFTSSRIGRYILTSKFMQRFLLSGMPLNFLLVRHGESEGNVANAAVKAGASLVLPAGFGQRHGSEWRLTERGVRQAKAAGEWIRRNFKVIHRGYTSTHIRAQETAGHLDLPGVLWFLNILQRERDWGIYERAERSRDAQYLALRAEMEEQPLLIAPTGGESIVSLVVRACLPLYDTLCRECSMQNVVTVCHGETMWAHLFHLTRMTSERYRELDRSKHPLDRIHNCQILHFTRMDPQTGKIRPSLDFVRWVCPWDETLSRGEWTEIVRPKFTSRELIARAESIPRLVA